MTYDKYVAYNGIHAQSAKFIFAVSIIYAIQHNITKSYTWQLLVCVLHELRLLIQSMAIP